MTSKRILMGVVGRPHGVRGLVRLVSYASSDAALASHVLTDERGRRWRVRWRGVGIAALVDEAGRELADRDAAAALTNLRLHVDRADLPEPDDEEFYLADLVGLAAFDADAAEDVSPRALGTVVAVHDYGAGASLEIAQEGAAPRVVAFTRAAVPVVDIAGGRVLIASPDEIEVPDEASLSPVPAVVPDRAAGSAP